MKKTAKKRERSSRASRGEANKKVDRRSRGGGGGRYCLCLTRGEGMRMKEGLRRSINNFKPGGQSCMGWFLER